MAASSFDSIIQAHSEAVRLSFDEEGKKLLAAIKDLIVETLKNKNKLLLCGNGGSAADAQHAAAEFTGRFKRERQALPAIALTTDTSALTAIANDYGYDAVFSRQVEALGAKGDLLIAISTSGNSPNVLKAVEKAKELGLLTVGFSGKDGGALKDAADYCFAGKGKATCHIQEVHELALHALCDLVEEQFAK